MPITSTLTIISYTEFKQNDTLPPLVFTLTDSNGPIDLTGVTNVKVYMKGKNTSTLIFGTCTIANLNRGECSYAWQAADTTTVDTYSVEALITFPGGRQTVPNTAGANPSITIDVQVDPPTG